ncbi:MAG: hypothetical protein ACQEVQ_10045 [Pseudomonadota bacterium]
MSKHDKQTKTEDAASMHAYERSRRDAGCGVSQEAQNEVGASPCNTAPPKYNFITVFNQGVDSLYLSYAGSLSIARCEELASLKGSAQSSLPDEKAEAHFSLCGLDFAVERFGSKTHAYIIKNRLFRIRIASSRASSAPVAYVEISSELLTVSGFEAALGLSDSLVAELVGKPCFPRISRVDICVDFSCDIDWSFFKDNQWCCRSGRKAIYHEREKLTGFTFGAGGEFSARLYDKTEEIKNSKKDFFNDIWRESGWDGETTIWRLEFQLRQAPVKEFGLLEPNEFMDNINAVWEYAAGKWLNLRYDNGDKNRSRWPLALVWEDLASVRFNLKNPPPAKRLSVESVPNREWLIIYNLGGLTSYMAANGIDDIEHAFNRFMADADEFFKETRRQDFSSALDYIDAKLEEKRTRFCMPRKHGKEQGDE